MFKLIYQELKIRLYLQVQKCEPYGTPVPGRTCSPAMIKHPKIRAVSLSRQEFYAGFLLSCRASGSRQPVYARLR